MFSLGMDVSEAETLSLDVRNQNFVKAQSSQVHPRATFPYWTDCKMESPPDAV